MFKGKSDTEDVNDESEKSIITDFKLDAEHRKFVLHDQYDSDGRPLKTHNKVTDRSKNSKSELKSEKALKGIGKENGKTSASEICLFLLLSRSSLPIIGFFFVRFIFTIITEVIVS